METCFPVSLEGVKSLLCCAVLMITAVVLVVAESGSTVISLRT